jgi:hypothetical protein
MVTVGCNEPARKESQPPPRSAAEILSDLEKERSAGRPDAALKLARDLMNTHGSKPEAERAAKHIPQLEAALKNAEEAERVRAANAAAAAEAQKLADKWTYRVNEDPMTSRASGKIFIRMKSGRAWIVMYSPNHR